MISTIEYEHGTETCTTKPGEITCRFFAARYHNTVIPCCGLFHCTLDMTEGGGLYLRCPACLEHDKAQERVAFRATLEQADATVETWPE